MAPIKHWGKRYSAFAETICSTPGCMNEGADYDRGQVKCTRCLVNALRLEAPRANARRTARGV